VTAVQSRRSVKPRGPANPMKSPAGRWLLRAAFLVALVLIWEFGTKAFNVPGFVFPAPSAIWDRLFQGFAKGYLIEYTAVTGSEIILGYLLGVVLGAGIGILIVQYKILDFFVYPLIVAINAVPKIALSPLLIIWVGTGMQSKVLIAALTAFFPLLVSVITGLRQVDAEQVLLMRAAGASKWQVFGMVALPNALPTIFGGLEVAIVLSVVGAIVGEFVGSQAGLGYYILFANARLDTASMFAGFVILAIIGTILNQLISLLARKIVFWRRVDVITA
jgi:NitT/TauT family transport system permease protein